MNRIYFFANLGDSKQHPYGGGEVGNRRTLVLLKRFKFRIILIKKYKRVPSHSIVNMGVLVFRMLCNIIKFFVILSAGHRKDSLVHIVGFYGPMIYFEYILLSIAKVLNYRTIYEMRGGGADLYYKEGSVRYRDTFTKLIKKTDSIFSQGRENYPLIRALCPNKNVFYYPNYVMHEFLPAAYPSKPHDRINFLYFGRISKTKNVDLVIDIFEIIAKRYKNVFLYIVGNAPEPDYAQSIKLKISNSEKAEKIRMLPACNHNELKRLLSDKHFYLFPTMEPHEGHSNALTEAMAWGVIPIATAHGFNKSVIGEDRLIVKDCNVNSFSSVIMDIIDNHLIDQLSEVMYDRVIQNFTEDVVGLRLEAAYRQMFSD